MPARFDKAMDVVLIITYGCDAYKALPAGLIRPSADLVVGLLRAWRSAFCGRGALEEERETFALPLSPGRAVCSKEG